MSGKMQASVNYPKHHLDVECEPRYGLWYPRVEGEAKHVYLELYDVRAADDLRISYDFERDGWVIEQAAVFEWEANDPVCDSEWAEVAFIQAWGRQRIPAPDTVESA